MIIIQNFGENPFINESIPNQTQEEDTNFNGGMGRSNPANKYRKNGGDNQM